MMNKDKAAKILPVLAAVLVISVIIGCVSLKSEEKNNEKITVSQNEKTYTVEEPEPTETETEETASVSDEATEAQSEKETEKKTEKETEEEKETSSSKTSSKASSSSTKTTSKTTKTTTTKKVVKATYVKGILIANKSYALPSDYAPGVNAEAKSAFNKMAADAAGEGIDLWIKSGYRSYSRQKEIYNNYAAQDGKAAADRYSARPGHSEHQTGLAFDVNSLSQSFENTAEGKWLAQNCWKYGFIIRYPKGKESVTGYMYEPWHIRYLGEATAKAVYDSGLTLEEYLGIDSRYSD